MDEETTAIDIRSLTVHQNVIMSLAFFIPLLISGPQLLTGSLVNFLLILGTRFVDKKNLLIISVLPSIAAVLNGLIFGKFTIFLVYFLPFIWLGNFALIKSILYLKKRSSLPLSIIFSVILKTIILYAIALIFINFKFVPEIFLTAMGVFQLITGIIGGVIFLGMNKLLNIKLLEPKKTLKH